MSTVLQFVCEIVLIIGVIAIAYIAMRATEDGIVHIINGVNVSLHK